MVLGANSIVMTGKWGLPREAHTWALPLFFDRRFGRVLHVLLAVLYLAAGVQRSEPNK